MRIAAGPQPRPGETGHLGFLDGIRGLAALWVVVGHCMIFGGWYWSKFPEPAIAVDVFMVVSGFLMVHQWTRRVGEGAQWDWEAAQEFWIRRFFRIVPVYYLCLAVMFANWDALEQGFRALQAANPERWQGQTAYDPAHWDAGPVNGALRLTFLFGLIPSYAVSSFTGDWSLSLEMQFYAAFPLAMLAVRRWGAAPVMWAAVAVAVLTRESTLRLQGLQPAAMWVYPLPSILLLKLPVFLVGMLLAETHRRFSAQPGRGALTLALALAVAALASWQIAAVAALTFFLLTDRALLAEGAQRWQTRVARMLGNRVMTFLADASYSVYLFHSLVIPLIGGWLLRQPWFETLPNRSRVGVLLGLVLLITYPLAAGLHRTVEQPGIEWGRRLARHWKHRSTRVAKG